MSLNKTIKKGNHRNMTLFNLQGKTALITGASSGLGERFSCVLSEAGAKVILVARRTDLIEELSEKIIKKGGKAIPLPLDVTDKDAVKKGVDELTARGEKIDILINNAGIARITPVFEDKDTHDFEDIINTNLLGVWYCTKMVANHMKQLGISGSVVNIASVYGLDKLEPKQTAYC